MAGEQVDGDVRRTIQDALARLRASGVKQREVAEALEVEPYQVSRWVHGRGRPSGAQLHRLAARWPGFFDLEHVAELETRSLRGQEDGGLHTIGVRVLGTSVEVYEAAADALEQDPKTKAARTIRHVALHLDRRDGVDPTHGDELFDADAAVAVERFASALQARAYEGWHVWQVVSAATPGRVDVLEGRVRRLEGADVNTRAYAGMVPPVLNLLLVADRDVFLAIDHPRFERPASALHLRSPSVVGWAIGVFELAYGAAPFDLRNPLGVQPAGFDALRRAVDPS